MIQQVERVPEEIVRHYQASDERSRITVGFGTLELVRTQEILRRHLPPPPARILDVGGGSGAHARWLADDCYTVHLIDPVDKHIAEVRDTLGHIGVTAEVGDARTLDVPDRSFDVVLLLGPLYHLTERQDRIAALREATRVARPGGLVAVAAISRFASLFDGLAQKFLFDPKFRAIAEQDLRDGQHRNPAGGHWFTTAYFHHPAELRNELDEAGLIFVDMLGVEGMAGWLSHLDAAWETPEGRETILFTARAVEGEPSLLGLSAHLLALATAPQ